MFFGFGVGAGIGFTALCLRRGRWKVGAILRVCADIGKFDEGVAVFFFALTLSVSIRRTTPAGLIDLRNVLLEGGSRVGFGVVRILCCSRGLDR